MTPGNSKKEEKTEFGRRHFVKLAWLGAIGGATASTWLFSSLYSGAYKKGLKVLGITQAKKKTTQASVDIWINKKSKVAGFINNKESSHLVKLNLANWDKQLRDEGAKFNRQQSPRIFEHIALQHLDDSDEPDFSDAIEILKSAFTDTYLGFTARAWRLYDLLALLIILSNKDNPEKAWEDWAAITGGHLVSINKLPWRNSWMKNKELFSVKFSAVSELGDVQTKLLNRI